MKEKKSINPNEIEKCSEPCEEQDGEKKQKVEDEYLNELADVLPEASGGFIPIAGGVL